MSASDRETYDARLLGLVRECAESRCDGKGCSTGKMHLLKLTQEWQLEYQCDECGERFWSGDPQAWALGAKIASEH